MKITNSVRRLYDSQLPINERLMARVKELFDDSKSDGWFYRGRIKPLESFAQKLETGRGGDPWAQEDFFACTIVVENRTAITDAISLVERFCDIVHRRPEANGETHKRPEAFPFDDLRLYVKLRPSGPSEPVDNVLFEVQIKTFLQHAWGIATRDLIYKGDQISWGKARVAYQVKAMLEHAEISIAKVDAFADADALAMNDEDTKVRNCVLEWLGAQWDPEQLPRDRRRLVDTILQLCRGLRITIDHIFEAVAQETERGNGTNLRNLSPYGIVLRALFARHAAAVFGFLRSKDSRTKLRLFITEEMELGPLPADANHNRFYVIDDEVLRRVLDPAPLGPGEPTPAHDDEASAAPPPA